MNLFSEIYLYFLVDFLKNQWKNLRDNFKRCLVRREALSKSGAEAHTLPRCKYFEQMQFVRDKVMNKETQSNVLISNTPTNVYCNFT